MEKRNLVHLELFRAWAIFWVMFNHTGTKGFFLFSVREGSPFYWVYLFISVACKFAVPLFFMISGGLLLKKEETIKTVYTKRVLRMTIILLVTSILYAVYDCWKDKSDFELISFLKKCYTYKASVALWYLYAYIAIMMMLPLLRRMVQGMKKNEYVYLALMSILFVGVIPIVQCRLSAGEWSLYSHIKPVLFTSVNVVFFIMGHFFENVLPEKYFTTRNAVIGWILSILCIVICCYMTVYQAELAGECYEGISQVFHESLIAVPTYTIYFSGKLLFMKWNCPKWIQSFICLIGGTTFGIYLLERILRMETQGVFEKLEPVIKTMPACFVWMLCAFILGVVVTLILKKLPLIKKFI